MREGAPRSILQNRRPTVFGNSDTRGIAIERSTDRRNPLKFRPPFLISFPKGDVDIDMPPRIMLRSCPCFI